MSRNVPIHGRPMNNMNPFDNNRPNLTASERTRDKRDKIIYQNEKQRFQTHKSCGNNNVRYYSNGRIRNMQSYKIQQSLARGSALCNDCNDKGLLCGDVYRSNYAKVHMGNNQVSEFWGGGGIQIVGNPAHLTQTPGFPVINVDISGTWSTDGSEINKNDITGGCGISGEIACPFGYATNVINIPRNLNGKGIIIDPSNLLFATGNCLDYHFNKYTELKTFLVVTGAVPIASGTGHVDISSTKLWNPSNCSDISYNSLPQSYITGWNGEENDNDIVFSGVIQNLCCKREQKMTYQDIFDNPNPLAPSKTSQVGIFDTYIELFSILKPDILSKWVHYTPNLEPSGGWFWPENVMDPHFIFNANIIDASGVFGHWRPSFIESMKIIQGSIAPSLNETTGNYTKQSYLSCIEDGTKKISFAKDNVKQEKIVKA